MSLDITEMIGGGNGIDRLGKKDPVVKTADVEKLVPGEITECALYLGNTNGTCMSSEAATAIGGIVGVSGDKKTIVEAAKAKLNCDSERCVLDKVAKQIGPDVARREISLYLKVRGPTDNQLLSNIHIDDTLQQWSKLYKNFYPYNFHMLNYASYSYKSGRVLNSPDTLATILFEDVYNGRVTGIKHRCVGCVINTDTYQGPGQHWMALFADSRGKDKWTVEFFNSSGNSPAPEWVNWMEKTRAQMEVIIDREKISPAPRVEMVKASSVRHQKSKSECGLYSLFYIWARLNNMPIEFFMNNHVPDQLMFEFRQHLFNDTGRTRMKKFDWNEYKNTVRIDWE